MYTLYNIKRPLPLIFYVGGVHVQPLTKIVKIRLPLTEAEKICVSQVISIYPKACNFVSKHIYKHEILSQTEVMRVLYDELQTRYHLSRYTAKSVIKTVVTRYRDRKTSREKWKRLRFRKNEHYFYKGIDYDIAEDEFYIRVSNDKIKCKVVDYNKYFGAFLDIIFGAATIQRGLFSYYLCVPITIDDVEMKEQMRWKVKLGLWLLWRSIKRKLLQKQTEN